MLRELKIRNVALVDELHVEFAPGFNALTGETGAGKSIIIGALEFVLGARADARSIRTGADRAVVDAAFELDVDGPIGAALRELGLECDDVLVLHRELTSNGRNRCHVNGSPVSVGMLGQIGDLLVDIHGQHDHQALLRAGTHLDVIDEYAGLGERRREIRAISEDLSVKRHERDDLAEGEREKAHQLDLHTFQVDEIQGAKLEPGEDEALRKERRILANAETLHRLLSTVYDALVADDGSAMTRLNEAARACEEAGRIDDATRAAFDELNDGIATIEDVASTVRARRDGIEFDPVRFEAIEERLALIAQLKRKYGNTIEEIVEFCTGCEEAIRRITHRDEELARLAIEIADLEKRLRDKATKLSVERKKAAKGLATAVERNLRELGMANGRFDVSFETKEPGPTGLDEVEFMISPNLGEEMKGLRQIASSGEISRTMLAVKSVLAASDCVPVLIFDEVDVNIGGETAAVVGDKLSALGGSHQVLCITHLAQVAGKATTHLAVYKAVDKRRTVTKINRLDDEARVAELARMLGGEKVSSETRTLARELLKR
ncbi:MAG: DNA repair protein RecN [Verrucomicrobia bacterium]|nr:DNA repair protein RecN [Verrucomicrobiota bacterium]